MVAIFPVLLSNAAGTLQCLHGGVFKAIGSTTTTIDGDPVAITKEGFVSQVTPCPGVPAAGIAPCVFGAPAQSMAVRVTIDSVAFKPVTVMMPQPSASNGMPSFIPKTKSTSTLVL